MKFHKWAKKLNFCKKKYDSQIVFYRSKTKLIDKMQAAKNRNKILKLDFIDEKYIKIDKVHYNMLKLTIRRFHDTIR
ncbi:hypothetical protein D9O36_13790 [Zobellia amurskyensis]|uniref:Uncharacterized protein n=1 Tax=Zobellia amurskyensis TaxID=248905 RepID=A0A7X3D2S0_9FLAO|nr:hypothetical protein [Zobellia amurskyensis]